MSEHDLYYEVCIKLKNAGFPMEAYRYAADVFEGGFVSPTLSELIEACGDDLDCLRNHKSFWIAYARHDDGYGNDFEMSREGETPEEAVANLWLELHANKK